VPKYLVTADYTTEGIQGLLAKGGTARREAVERLVTQLGGRIEALYFAFGDHDAFIIVDLPDNVTAAAVSLSVGSSGMVSTSTTVLLTPEEVDRAAQVKVDYSPPGA
jgi:uncharacterized protein with GYD domain